MNLQSSFEFNTDFFIYAHDIQVKEPEGESVGFALLSTNVDPTVKKYDFWYDQNEEGLHYVCLPTNEYTDDGEEELEPMLLEDFLEIFKGGL